MSDCAVCSNIEQLVLKEGYTIEIERKNDEIEEPYEYYYQVTVKRKWHVISDGTGSLLDAMVEAYSGVPEDAKETE